MSAVVIGAGLGGLGAGLRLAHAGVPVRVIEQHNLPGGFATSFVRGRFEFEPSLHELAGVGSPEHPGMVRRFLDEVGVEVDLVEVPHAYRVVLSETGTDVDVPFGREGLIQAVEAHAPGSRAVVSRYLDLCQRVTRGLMAASDPSLSRARLVLEHGDLLRTAPYTMAEVGEAMGITPRMAEVLYPYWAYLGLPTSRASFTIWGAMLTNYLSFGGWVPTQRSHGLALAMVRRIQELGGWVELRTRVERIETHGGAVVAVHTSHGERIPTSQVLCNATPWRVASELLDQAPPALSAGVRARVQGPSGLVVYLGLDASPQELGLRDYAWFLMPDMDTDRAYRSFCTLQPPQVQAAVCLNAAVPDCSPPGTTILSLTTLTQGAAWEGLAPQDYVATKTRFAESMIRQFEAATGADVRGHIEEIEIATPQTFARYTGAHNGNIYGYEPEPWDSLIPRAMAASAEEHVPGLRFVGGHAARCHGYSSSLLSGSLAAAQVVRDLEVRS